MSDDLIKHAIEFAKTIGVVIFTYVFAVKKTIKAKSAEICLEQKREAEDRLDSQSRQFPLLTAAIENHAAVLKTVNQTLEMLNAENIRTRARIDHISDSSENYRTYIDDRINNMQESLDRAISKNRDAVNEATNKITEISVLLSEIIGSDKNRKKITDFQKRYLAEEPHD